MQFQGAQVRTLPLQHAVLRLKPGDTLRLVPGTYTTPAVIRAQGLPFSPIRIIGASVGKTILDGQQPRTNAINNKNDPGPDDFAFLKMIRAQRMTLEGLSFRNCWPSAIYMAGCQRIKVQNCEITGGRFGVFAANARILQRTRWISLSGVHWVQDPERTMWSGETTWHDVKQTEPEDEATAEEIERLTRKGCLPRKDASYFNGALFGSWDIPGPVTVRGCTVEHAFNAIRIDAPDETTGNRNTDIRIIGNRFAYLRDNGVEPESFAERLWVINNSFLNCHTSFSFDGVKGRDWYLFGNRTLKLQKPAFRPQCNRDGKTHKFYQEGPFPSGNFYSGFNSTFSVSEYVGAGTTRHWTHSNNAMGFIREGQDSEPDVRIFRNNPKGRFSWHSSINFGDDLSDHPRYPDGQIEDRYLVSGISAGRSAFSAPALDPSKEGTADYWDGHLNLAPGSPGIGTSREMHVRLPGGRKETIPAGRNFGGPAPDQVLEWAMDGRR